MKNKKPLYLFFFFGVFFLLPPANGQQHYYYTIQSYSAADAFKPYQAVNQITEDHNGLLWIGTDNGLYNFDGKFFKLYNHKLKVPGSLASNLVHYNYEDKSGRYWVYIYGKGLYNFLPEEGLFKKFTAANENEFNINNFELSFPFEDKEGNLWFGAFKYGIAKYNRVTNSLIPYKICFPNNCGRYRTASWVTKFFEDPIDYSFWLCTNNGLVHFNPLNGLSDITYDKKFKNKGQENVDILTSICADRNKDIWIGTMGKGIKKLNRSKKTFETFLPFPQQPDGIKNSCEGIALRDSQTLWISSIDQGLLVFNILTKKFSPVSSINQLSIIKNTQSLFQSKKGVLWFSMDKKVFKLNPEENLWSFHPFLNETNKAMEQVIPANFIRVNQNIFIGTKTNGSFYSYNLQSEKIKSYLLPNGKNKYTVEGTAKDSKGNIWIATNEGFFIFDPVRGNIYSPPVTTGNKETLRLRCNSIAFDKENNVWIGSYDGLIKYNILSKHIELFNTEHIGKNYLPTSKIITVYCDASDNVWVGTNLFGIGCLKKGDSSFIFFNNSRNKNYLQENCSSITENINGEILFTLRGEGLFILRNAFTSKENIENINSLNVLPSDNITGVLKDTRKRIWVYSAAGVSLLNLNKLQSINFTQKEGLLESSFVSTPYQDEEGNLYVGGKGGFQLFNADSLLKDWVVTPVIHFSDFRINGKPYQTKSFTLDSGNALLLNPTENNINFQFAALSTSFSNLIRYAYKLEGYDKDWIETEKNNITYSNLSSGKYKLLIKTGNFIYIWNKHYFSLSITIKKPWYRQAWFFLLCAIAILSLISIWYHYRIKNIQDQLELKSKYEKQIAEIEMKALRAQMNPHFIFNCLNSINRYIVKSDEKTASSYLTKFSKLIRLILDNSTLDTIPIEKEIETLKLYIDMEALRFDHVFDYSIEASEEIKYSSVEIPSMLIQPYVENAIWHGLLHLPANQKDKEDIKGLLKIVFMKQDDKTVIVTIRDNGIGRLKAAELKSKDVLKQKSYGMQITSDRIQLINNLYNMNASVVVYDLNNNRGESEGTEVVIRIQLK
ncbi:MAG: two-component regulator propeller domain-containing protein [Chitinophagaceae bacterium]